MKLNYHPETDSLYIDLSGRPKIVIVSNIIYNRNFVMVDCSLIL